MRKGADELQFAVCPTESITKHLSFDAHTLRGWRVFFVEKEIATLKIGTLPSAGLETYLVADMPYKGFINITVDDDYE